MPQNRNSEPPPEAMTWKKASLVLIVAALFDLIRMFFEMFWFFGPAIFAAACSVKVGSVMVVGKLLATGCVAASAVAGSALLPVLVPFSVVMSISAGLMGFLLIGLYLTATNARIFKANVTGSVWFAGGFAISAIPLIGTIPAFTLVLWKLYKTQIRVEQAALKKWQEKHAAEQVQERQQRAAQLLQESQEVQGIKEAQLVQEQEVENEAEAEYEKNSAENEIPDDVHETP